MEFFLAVSLTTLAGLSTGVGGALSFFIKKRDEKFLSVCLGFAAGVMLYLSMTEILSEAGELLGKTLGDAPGSILTVVCFFTGILAVGLVDRLVPHDHDSHGRAAAPKTTRDEHRNLMRTGVFTALALSIHNIPEGIAMFISVMQQPSVALPLVIAVMIHNIPAGIAVAVPIYYATGNKSKAFLYSLVTGLIQPIAAIIGYQLLMPVMSDTVFGLIYASVAGFMIFIALDDLLPSALKYGDRHNTTYGLISGMAVMAASLLMFS